MQIFEEILSLVLFILVAQFSVPGAGLQDIKNHFFSHEAYSGMENKQGMNEMLSMVCLTYKSTDIHIPTPNSYLKLELFKEKYWREVLPWREVRDLISVPLQVLTFLEAPLWISTLVTWEKSSDGCALKSVHFKWGPHFKEDGEIWFQSSLEKQSQI